MKNFQDFIDVVGSEKLVVNRIDRGKEYLASVKLTKECLIRFNLKTDGPEIEIFDKNDDVELLSKVLITEVTYQNDKLSIVMLYSASGDFSNFVILTLTLSEFNQNNLKFVFDFEAKPLLASLRPLSGGSGAGGGQCCQK